MVYGKNDFHYDRGHAYERDDMLTHRTSQPWLFESIEL